MPVLSCVPPGEVLALALMKELVLVGKNGARVPVREITRECV